jgi:hypothetical protein
MKNTKKNAKKNSRPQLLPAQFKDLERFVAGWALPTEQERNHKRLSSSITEIQELYDALLPRIEAMMNYLNQFPLDNMPEDAQRLFLLGLAFAEIAMAVEAFKQPAVVDGFEPARFIRVDVPNMTPQLEFERSARRAAGS